MNEGWKHDTLGAEIKESLLLIALAVARITTFFCVPVPQVPIPKRWCRGLGDTCVCSELHYIPEFREPKYFLMGSKHVWPLIQQESVSPPPSLFTGKHPWEASLEQRQSLSLLIRHAETWKTHGEFSLNYTIENTLLLNTFIWVF